MEWTECLRGAIAYMEKNLLEDIGPADVAEAVHISPFYLQHGFRMVTGYTLGEYMRCRRLYLAALDMLGEGSVLETAYKYGYDNPERFTKAFTRFLFCRLLLKSKYKEETKWITRLKRWTDLS